MAIPSPDEWSFAELPADRQGYLDDDMPFEEIANRVAAVATVERGCVCPLRKENPEAPIGTTWRAQFTISVEPDQLSDRCYNGRDGVRGRYWQSEQAGDAATAFSIALLRDKLLRFASDNPDKFGAATLARGDQTLVERSLCGRSAKSWAYEKKPEPNFNEGPKLIVRRWANNRPGGIGDGPRSARC